MSGRETIHEEAKADRYYESIGSREECSQSRSGRHSPDPACLTFDSSNGLGVECMHCGQIATLPVDILIECASDAIDWPVAR